MSGKVIKTIFLCPFSFLFFLLSIYILLPCTAAAQSATLPATLELKQIDGYWTPWQNDMPLPTFEKQNRVTINLGGTWRRERFNANHDFTLDRRNQTGLSKLVIEGAGRHSANYDDSAWGNITIPGIENELVGYEATPEYYENGVWYRRTFTVPDSLKDHFLKLVFYAVNYVADVWLNDQYLGYHEGGYTPFAFAAGAQIKYGGNNVLAVRVDNPPWGSRKDIIPFYRVDWFNYTGIIHDVYLEASAPAHLSRADVVPLDSRGNLQVTTLLYNSGSTEAAVTAKIEIFQADPAKGELFEENSADFIGEPAAITGPAETTLSVAAADARVWRTNIQITEPHLWWPNSPNLYILRVSLHQSGRLTDQIHSQFGIRTLRVSGDQVQLNGKPAFFAGAARHEDHPFYGRSIPVNEIGSDLQKIKNLNNHFLRTAHYPNHPATYLIADRLGLVVMEEIPLWWFDTAEVWEIQNNQRHLHEQMWREMIFRDYNRPSIALWSTCNECMDVPNRKIFIQRVHDDLDSHYPDGRLVTQSAAADRPGPQDASQAACDVAGWTTYFGIFYGSDYYNDTKTFLNKVEIFYPDKPVVITEYGYWSSEDGSSAARQRDVFSNTFHAIAERAAINGSGQLNAKGFIMAATWWCVFDWYTCQQRNGYQSMGLYHMDRVNKKTVVQSYLPTYLPYYTSGGVTAVESHERPEQFELFGSYPNPFNAQTRIALSLRQKGHVLIEVYNLKGQLLATLADEEKAAGVWEYDMNGARYGSGIYLVRCVAGEDERLLKITLVK